jgi:hypothetical protein
MSRSKSLAQISFEAAWAPFDEPLNWADQPEELKECYRRGAAAVRDEVLRSMRQIAEVTQ